MREIPLGATGSYALTVAAEHLANRFKDPLLPPVFATPMMVLAIENAALAAIKPYLEPGESAVGSRVDLQHLAATPIGQRVTAWAEVTAVTGRRIEFKVRAQDETEEIGIGTHERVVIDMRRFGERLSAKAGPTAR
jgi:fluoroacetyl-CoA thioesterase